MTPTLASMVRDWDAFFGIIGVAAATLVGAMFIVASIGSGMLKTRRGAARPFISPTITHVSVVLLGSALVMVPSFTWESMSATVGLGAIAGVIFSSVVGWQVCKRKVDLEDKFLYGVFPLLAYAIMAASAPFLWLRWRVSIDVFAFSLVLLLIIGLRNAWDMTIFIVGGDWERQ